MILTDETTYTVSDELYIVRVLNGFDMCGSSLDNLAYVKSLYHILDDLKNISEDNVHELWTKGTSKEVYLYEKCLKHIKFKKDISFGYYLELVNNALSANDGIYPHDIVHMCSDRLSISKTGLLSHELEEEVRKFFNKNVVISRKEIDEFTNHILKGRYKNDI